MAPLRDSAYRQNLPLDVHVDSMLSSLPEFKRLFKNEYEEGEKIYTVISITVTGIRYLSTSECLVECSFVARPFTANVNAWLAAYSDYRANNPSKPEFMQDPREKAIAKIYGERLEPTRLLLEAMKHGDTVQFSPKEVTFRLYDDGWRPKDWPDTDWTKKPRKLR